MVSRYRIDDQWAYLAKDVERYAGKYVEYTAFQSGIVGNGGHLGVGHEEETW